MSSEAWLFATVALLVVAALAFSLGRLWERLRSFSVRSPQNSPLPAQEAAKEPEDRSAISAEDKRAVIEAQAEPAARSGLADEISAFHYTITHDLRAPLRVIEGFTKILKEDYGRQFDRIGNDHLERIQGATQRMNSMLESMLSLARISQHPLAREPVNLSQLAHQIAQELQQSAPDRQAKIEIDPDLLVIGDPTLLRQLMENLLSDAWKYSAKQNLARIGFQCQRSADGATYTVSDNGAGFDMKSASRLFGLFQRLHSASQFQGNGVGLASVQRIVNRHGGRIWAESQIDQGARFHFTLGE